MFWIYIYGKFLERFKNNDYLIVTPICPKMKLNYLILILLIIPLVNATPSLNFFPNPGEAGVSIEYTWNITSNADCSGVLISHNEVVTTNSRGWGFVSIDISSLNNTVPERFCEYKDGILRDNMSYSDIIFNSVRAKNFIGGNFTGDFGNLTSLIVSGDTILNDLNVTENINVDGNITANYGFFDYLGSLVNRITEIFVTETNTINLNVTNNATFSGQVNIPGDLNVSGNATFTGPFETNCLHCEDNDTYFHRDGYFEGNVTAPNIEVMESLIVHGNSTCSGTATVCGDIGDSGLCGWTINTGQRGCRWRWFFGDCSGTATPCDEMSTATCEEQHVCSLTTGGAGFIISGLGLTGNFSVNTTGNITAGTYFGDGSQLTGAGNSSWNETLANSLYAKYQFGNNNFNGSGNITTSNLNIINGSLTFCVDGTCPATSPYIDFDDDEIRIYGAAGRDIKLDALGDGTYSPDGKSICWGDLRDSCITFNGSTWIFNPDRIGNSPAWFDGNIQVGKSGEYFELSGGGSGGKATGNGAFAWGQDCIASGDSSVCLGGVGSEASGIGSMTMGGVSFSTGQYALSSGFWTYADGHSSVAFGHQTDVDGDGSMAGGFIPSGFPVWEKIAVTGDGSFLWCYGESITDDPPSDNVCDVTGQASTGFGELIHLDGNNAYLFGRGITNAESDSFMIGWDSPDFKVNATNTDINGSLKVTGNFTGNQIYGEMWYHNHTGTTTNFIQDTLVPMFFVNATFLNGFSFVGGFESSSNLTAQIDGRYQATYRLSGSGQNNHVYFSTILINGLEQDKCGDHKKISAGGDIVPMGNSCFIELLEGDDVQVAVMDYGASGDGDYYSGTLNLVRIGS